MPRQFPDYKSMFKWIDAHIGTCVVCLGEVPDMSATGLCLKCDNDWCAYANSINSNSTIFPTLYPEHFLKWTNDSIIESECAECEVEMKISDDYLCNECRAKV